MKWKTGRGQGNLRRNILDSCFPFVFPSDFEGVLAVLAFPPLVPEAMPKVKRSRKPPPDGWELIEPTLDELDQKMREGECVVSGMGPQNKLTRAAS